MPVPVLACGACSNGSDRQGACGSGRDRQGVSVCAFAVGAQQTESEEEPEGTDLGEDVVPLKEVRQRERLDLGARGVLDVGEQRGVEREVGKALVGELDHVVGRAAVGGGRRGGGGHRGRKDGRRCRVGLLLLLAGHPERRLLLLLLARRAALGLSRARGGREDTVGRPGRATRAASAATTTTAAAASTATTAAAAASATAATAASAAGRDVVGVEHEGGEGERVRERVGEGAG